MSLATRCSACSTVFRVQKDQLKASEGWVRCGRCGTVFSALEGLFDLERESHSGPMPLHSATPAAAPTPAPRVVPPPSPPPPQPQPQPPPQPPPPPPSVPSAAAAPARRVADEDDDDDAPTQALLHDDSLQDAQSDRAADRAASMAAFRALQQPATHDDQADDDDEAALSLLEHSGSHTLGESRPLDSGLGGPSSLSSQAGPPSVLPSFAREPDSAVRWRQQLPVVRRLTIAAALALPLLLAAQVALHHRNMVAARWPGTAEVLRAVCASLNCSVQAPRALEALTVESSGLTRVEGSPLYRLQVALRNRAAWAVAMPTLDVTLTDARGEVVVRRALRPEELAVSAPAELGASAEWSATATLDVGERRVTGYTIDLFYP